MDHTNEKIIEDLEDRLKSLPVTEACPFCGHCASFDPDDFKGTELYLSCDECQVGYSAFYSWQDIEKVREWNDVLVRWDNSTIYNTAKHLTELWNTREVIDNE